jgi:hypothetical protein
MHPAGTGTRNQSSSGPAPLKGEAVSTRGMSKCGYCPEGSEAEAGGVFGMVLHIEKAHPEVIAGLPVWEAGTIEGHFYASADGETPVEAPGRDPPWLPRRQQARRAAPVTTGPARRLTGSRLAPDAKPKILRKITTRGLNCEVLAARPIARLRGGQGPRDAGNAGRAGRLARGPGQAA